MTTMDDMDMDEYSSDEEDYFSVNELLQKHLCCPSTDSEDSIRAIKNDNDLKESMCLDSNNNDTSSYAVIPTDNFVLPEVDDREYILPEDRSPSVDTYDSNDEVNSEEYIHHDDDEYIGNGGHTGGGNRSFSPYISDSELISHSPKKLNQLDQYDGILNHQKLPLIYTTDLQSNDPIQDRLYTAGPSSRLLSTLISSNQSQGNREESRPSGVTNHFHIDDRYIQYIDNEFPYQLYDPTTGRSICDEEVDDFVNRNINRVGKKFVCAFTGHQSRQCTEVPRPRSSVKDHVESILRFRCLVCGPILAGKGNIRYHMQRHGLKRNVIKK